jgi:hypothetical protein
MYKSVLLALFCLLFTVTVKLAAQEQTYKSVFGKNDSINAKTSYYGGFVHQHQNFFDQAFSYQGLEIGVLLKNKFITGIYAATFISDFNTEIEEKPMFIRMSQAGAMVGGILKNQGILHVGWQLNTGYFSLNAEPFDSKENFSGNSDIFINGLVLSPQFYAEINLSDWMKFRTGLAYNFYFFEDEPSFEKYDIQNFSLNFGFIFGKFN